MGSTVKVLLIYPTPSIASPQKSPPLSILYVGEALKQAKKLGKSDEKYKVRYYDERYDPLPDMDWPDVVGVSSMTGYQLKGAIFWLQKAKEYGKRTILGGIHVTMQPEQCLQENYVDSVVLSEGEWAILDAIHGERIAQRHLNGEHVSPVSPDTLIHFQRSAKTGDTILLTSRGCPFRCGFCYTQKFFERKWESVDLDRWKHDILYLKENAGLTKLEHGDDWIGKWPRAHEIIKFLWDNKIQYRPSMRAHQIDEVVAYEMKHLGIKNVSIGMETASPRILELVNKDITKEDQIVCAYVLAKQKIWPLYYWIVGFPTETQQEMNQTLDMADEMDRMHRGKLTQDIYAYVALPGSAMFDMVDKSKLPQTMEEWSNYSLNQTYNKQASNIYHIGGFHFHRGKGDKTDRNFPGWRRLQIAPFEALMNLRWKFRYFNHFGLEKWVIERLLKRASRRQ
jgi:radical SAM superfamily enzyme YgiQ (UPF0313 family)